MIKVYGIKNCDTVKKALKLLNENEVEYTFVDFKKESPSKDDIKRWKEFVGDWPVNKRGTTYRKVKEEFEAATDAAKTKLISENTSLIKRPVLEVSGKVQCLGFDKEIFENL